MAPYAEAKDAEQQLVHNGCQLASREDPCKPIAQIIDIDENGGCTLQYLEGMGRTNRPWCIKELNKSNWVKVKPVSQVVAESSEPARLQPEQIILDSSFTYREGE